jgi:hypothetical protein
MPVPAVGAGHGYFNTVLLLAYATCCLIPVFQQFTYTFYSQLHYTAVYVPCAGSAPRACASSVCREWALAELR